MHHGPREQLQPRSSSQNWSMTDKQVQRGNRRNTQPVMTKSHVMKRPTIHTLEAKLEEARATVEQLLRCGQILKHEEMDAKDTEEG